MPLLPDDEVYKEKSEPEVDQSSEYKSRVARRAVHGDGGCILTVREMVPEQNPRKAQVEDGGVESTRTLEGVEYWIIGDDGKCVVHAWHFSIHRLILSGHRGQKPSGDEWSSLTGALGSK